MEAGMNGFITKPIDMDRAVALLRSVIARGVAQVPEYEQVEVEEALQPKLDVPVVLNQDYGLRVFKTREKYQRYLHLFVQMYERSIDELEALTEQPELLRALVHKMRGGAGHLGIDQVRDLCAQLESEIDEHLAYANTLEKLGNALRNCFEQIERHFPLDKPVESAMEAILDPAQLIEPLKALHAQLQNYDLDSANSIFQGVSSKLKATDRMALQNCIDLFDANGALAEVERIAADLKIALK
jgi:HPt (histidine-containing phosphotransfer) domain-containing protein